MDIISCLGPAEDIQLLLAVYGEDRRAHSRVQDTLQYLVLMGQKAVKYIGGDLFLSYCIV